MSSRDIYGFNYDGSWGSSGLDVWAHHDSDLMAIEIARGKGYFPEWNTARWWLSHEAYQRDPAKFLANFESGLSIFAGHDLKVIPVLFNRWRDPVCDFGGVPIDHLVPYWSAWNHSADLFASADPAGRKLTIVEELFTRYVEDVVGTHAQDDRIRMWDLCNEPLMGLYINEPESPVRQAELTWLGWCYEKCKQVGAVQPLTIGNYPNATAVALTEPISDVLSFHPYWMWQGNDPQKKVSTKEGFEAYLDECVAIADKAGKDLVGNETVWGARDDAKHVEVMRYTLGELVKRGIGFTVHALHHSLVADLHRDEFGPVGRPDWMHFIEADGSLRAGHEAFNEFAPSRVRQEPAYT